MTNHEAIEMIRNDMKLHHNYSSWQYRKALNMAISALEAQEQKERNCSTCKHKDLCAAFWTQEIEDAPCRDCDDLVYQKWESQELVNNSKKLDSENNEYLTTNLRPNLQLMHWIPCSERLPEDDTLMLVNYIDSRPDVMDIWIGWHEMENVWYIDGDAHSQEYGNEVIAWMPLPEPYREDES